MHFVSPCVSVLSSPTSPYLYGYLDTHLSISGDKPVRNHRLTEQMGHMTLISQTRYRVYSTVGYIVLIYLLFWISMAFPIWGARRNYGTQSLSILPVCS